MPVHEDIDSWQCLSCIGQLCAVAGFYFRLRHGYEKDDCIRSARYVCPSSIQQGNRILCILVLLCMNEGRIWEDELEIRIEIPSNHQYTSSLVQSDVFSHSPFSLYNWIPIYNNI